MKEPRRFKPFRETFTKVTFALCVGMIYPNPRAARGQVIGIMLQMATAAPFTAMILIDMYYSWLDRDIINIIRHSTVIGPFLGGFFKMLLMFYYRDQAKLIMDEIDSDYESYNRLPGEFRRLASESVHNSIVYCERIWVIIVSTCVMVFPGLAVVQMVYEFSFASEPHLYMIHDMNKPFATNKEDRFESPYFEIIFVYTFYCSLLYVVNFIGYDGFFGLTIHHACLKMDLYCKAMDEAMKAPTDVIHKKIVSVIRDQNRMFEFVKNIQEAFNIWLGIIFLATMIQICTCLYHITEGYGFDLRYTIFVIGAVIHIYLPCKYAAKLKAMSAETATKIYSCGWENVPSHSIRKMVLLMVARAQTPLEITAMGMVTFDMELFLSIMQTSYSMFTLLRS